MRKTLCRDNDLKIKMTRFLIDASLQENALKLYGSGALIFYDS